MDLLFNYVDTFTNNSNNDRKDFFSNYYVLTLIFLRQQAPNVIICGHLLCARDGARQEWKEYIVYIQMNKDLISVLREGSICAKDLGHFFSHITRSVEDSKTLFVAISWKLPLLFISKD